MGPGNPAHEFETCAPDARLGSIILCYWRLSGLAAGVVYAAAPKRHVELVINVGAPQLAYKAKDTAASLYRSCWLTGLRARPLFIVPTGSNILYGVRFKDFAVPQWLTGDIARSDYGSTDLHNASVTLPLVAAVEPCADLASAAPKFDAFFLGGQEYHEPIAGLRHAIEECERAHALSPSAILRRLDSPPRHVRTLVKSTAGITIRRFARLARFDRALVRLTEQPLLRIADLAQEVGYYDEPHMTHDFAAFGVTTPRAYRRARQARGIPLPHHLYPL